jgi:hypothetical protein
VWIGVAIYASTAGRSNREKDIWTDPPTFRSVPRRWWMWLVPVVVAVQIIFLFAEAPWAELSAS